MDKQRSGVLAGVSFGLLTVALCASVTWAAPPVHEVILESYSEPDWATGGDVWKGDAIIWIDGEKYEGTILYTAEGESNKNGWHGTEIKIYDFPDLGEIELSGAAKTIFAYVSPEHRWHRYTSHARITNGTGVFEGAQGVLQFVGYTNWILTSFPPGAYAFEGAQAKIVGIQLDIP